jgi:hypothetical protein
LAPDSNSSDDPLGGRAVYIEFVPIGKQVKVSAIDPVTGVEVSIMGPTDAREEDLERIAIQKLRYRLRREAGGDADNEGNDGSGQSGLIV